ncbi:protein SPT2 homolog isoform X1 [Astyanax mexicanus]|uniref:protein SPT2 homolog isoform X1 n=1 Tax=Astyanax mexicanus TaxID=7994 RepID=UPI0020CB0D00|nr:protein SPT2 homolog isoform X1 [Astyanax mexicanus]
MDFHRVLSMASEKQSGSNAQKRYSLTPGPPKKDPKVKGVNSAAVQAFLKKQETEHKKKELLKKKEKEELLAKRVELKSDRKARAMASRTKDNFRGYNGIPVVEQPKKRRSKGEPGDQIQDTSDVYDDEDDYEYAETDSESEPEPTPVRPQPRSDGPSKMSHSQKKPSAPPKGSRPPMNFADLLRLAEKKQFEPVELKPVTKKPEGRLRTADEIRELELERKVKKQDRGKDSKGDRSSGQKESKPTSNSHKKNGHDRDIREGKPHKSSGEKQPSGVSKAPKQNMPSERPHSSAKLSNANGSKHSSSSSGALSGKTAIKGGGPVSSKQAVPRPQSGQKTSPSSDLTSKKGYPGLPQKRSSGSGSRHGADSNPSRPPGHGQGIKGSGQVRPGQSMSSKGGPPQKPGKGEVPRSGGAPTPRPGNNGPMRSAPGGPSKQAGTQQPRPGGSQQSRPVPGGARPSANGPSRSGGGVPARPSNSMGQGPGRPQCTGVPARPSNSMGQGPGRPQCTGVPARPSNSMGQGPGRTQCTVVSETISSKNFAPKPGMAPRPSAPQGPKTVIGPTGHRILVRPNGVALPPITSSYKRKYEDEEEEYDSEMDDFIDDEGEEQDEISKHIREIFGYDRTRYKDESDYALKYMESSWKEQQKEEARSLRMGIKEDEEDMRMEEEEMKRKQAMKAKQRKT